jgi:hypothetical protein
MTQAAAESFLVEGGSHMNHPTRIPSRGDAEILRDLFAVIRDGLVDDLEHPGRLRDPDRARREVDVYDRLLETVDGGKVETAAEVRRILAELFESVEAESQAERDPADREALRRLLARIEGRA